MGSFNFIATWAVEESSLLIATIEFIEYKVVIGGLVLGFVVR